MLRTIAAGAAPKLIMSASESSCTPISEYCPKSRADAPSRKSNAADAVNSQKHSSRGRPSAASITAIVPQMRLQSVRMLGTVNNFIFMTRVFNNVQS